MGGAPGVDEGIAVWVATAEAKLIEETLGCPVAAVHTPVGSRAGGILAAAAAVGAGLVVVEGGHLGIVEELFTEPERALEAAARTLGGTTTARPELSGQRTLPPRCAKHAHRSPDWRCWPSALAGAARSNGRPKFSVSRSVTHHTHLPLLLVPRTADGPRARWPPPRREPASQPSPRQRTASSWARARTG